MPSAYLVPMFQHSEIQATGYPVFSGEIASLRNGKVQHVTDFGRCDGIKHVKGFAGILAKQKASVKAERRARKVLKGIK